MSSILLAPPALEPPLATGYALTRRALIAQTWRLVHDAWPASGRLDVFPAPLRQVLAARVYDSGGEAQAIDAFTIDNAAAPGVIAFAPRALPQPGRAVAGIEIDVVAGYGTTAAAVPEPLAQAIRQLLAYWYENRGLAAIGQSSPPLPATVAALIAPYRVLSL